MSQDLKDCFIIMPFSETDRCSESQWTSIFSTLIKPAVEEAGLGYVCRRSNATRGNIVRGILEDLSNSDVVIADLTDRNPNVFYELGVRHALRERTILITQVRDHIPFDLQSYASHVYGWKDDQDIATFKKKIRELLLEIETNPDRPDNPVRDFLGERVETNGSPAGGLLVKLLECRFSGAGWFSGMPELPLRFSLKLDMRNFTDDFFRLVDAKIENFRCGTDLISSPVLAKWLRGTNPFILPYDIESGHWASDIHLIVPVKLAEERPTEFARRMMGLENYYFDLPLRFEKLNGQETPVSIAVEGSFSPFKDSVIEYWESIGMKAQAKMARE